MTIDWSLFNRSKPTYKCTMSGYFTNIMLWVAFCSFVGFLFTVIKCSMSCTRYNWLVWVHNSAVKDAMSLTRMFYQVVMNLAYHNYGFELAQFLGHLYKERSHPAHCWVQFKTRLFQRTLEKCNKLSAAPCASLLIFCS